MGTTVSSGVTRTITSEVSGLVVASGGALLVASGGIALSATVSSGGSLTVLAGGLDSGSVVQSGGSETVSGGSAAATADDGILTVAAGGVASGTYVQVGIGEPSGTLEVASGGIAIAPIVPSYQPSPAYFYHGAVIVESGGELSGGGGFVTLEAGGSLAPGGGTFSGLDVTSGAAADIAGGLSATNATVAGGGSVVVGPGGFFAGAIDPGAFVAIEGGGADGAVAGNGGTVVIGAGGVDLFQALGTLVLSGSASLVVQSGGTVEVEDRFRLEGMVDAAAGGEVLLTNYGSAGPLVMAGGTMIVSATALTSAAIAGQGAVITIGSGATAIGDGVSGGTLALQAGAVLSGGLVFDQYGYGGEIVISGTTLPTVPVSGLGRDETIDLPNIPFDPAGTISAGTISAGTGAIAFAENGYDYSLPIVSAGLVGQTVLMAPDTAGGTMIEVSCFAAGTRIATDRGDVMVQHLNVGDCVRLANGSTAAVVWLGHRRVDCALHPRRQDVLPVRIAAHAFGLGRPVRDVFLSPDHAVFADGVLIPIRYLLNDATVRQEDAAVVTYWHVELAEHGVLLAEGLPAESYLDTGNRAAFANAGAAVMAHPDFARSVWAARGCAPLVMDGAARDQVYRRLVAQAFALGWRQESLGENVVRWLPPEAPSRTQGQQAARA